MANKAKIKINKSLLIERVPVDIQKAILKKQGDECDDCKCTRGQDYTIFKMIREWSNAYNLPPDHFAISTGGHIHISDNNDTSISFDGLDVIITTRVSITSRVGAHLNYLRHGKG